MPARAHSISALPKRFFRPGQSGVGALEFLIALPILLVLGLGAWQWAIVLQARQVLEHAVAEAARGGALGHASEQSIDQGLARGLLTFWPSRSGREPKAQLAQSEARLSEAQQANWIAWRQLSPMRESFGDWAEPALDARGLALPGLPEIPIDNLDARIQAMRPLSGIDRWLGVEPVGRLSGQTLRDASVLRIELQVALPLQVPLAGRFIAAAAGWSQSCAPPCLVAQSTAEATADTPRILIRVHAETRMHTPPRMSARTPSRTDSADWVAGPASPAGREDSSALPRSGAAPETDHATAPAQANSPAPEATHQDAKPASPVASVQMPDPAPARDEIWTPGACGMQPG